MTGSGCRSLRRQSGTFHDEKKKMRLKTRGGVKRRGGDLNKETRDTPAQRRRISMLIHVEEV